MPFPDLRQQIVIIDLPPDTSLPSGDIVLVVGDNQLTGSNGVPVFRGT